jgi:hypothetical protein
MFMFHFVTCQDRTISGISPRDCAEPDREGREDLSKPTRPTFAADDVLIVKSLTSDVLHGTSGPWRVWSLSDGYLDMPAHLLHDAHNNPVKEAAHAGPQLRLSVNCFALAGPSVDGVLIDCGGGN